MFGRKPKSPPARSGTEPEYDADEQTGIVYMRRLEEPGDTAMARVSFVYLLLALGGLFLLLLDTWSGRDAALSAPDGDHGDVVPEGRASARAGTDFTP